MMPAKRGKEQEALVPGLARPAMRALANAGITRRRQFSRFTEDEIAALHGMGPRALGQIKQTLRQAGLGFAKPRPKRAT
jgi:hypothetical protein